MFNTESAKWTCHQVPHTMLTSSILYHQISDRVEQKCIPEVSCFHLRATLCLYGPAFQSSKANTQSLSNTIDLTANRSIQIKMINCGGVG